MTDLKFNIGKSRSEFIGSLTNAVTNQYIITKLESDERSALQYLAYQEALYLELQTWIEEDQEGKTKKQKDDSSAKENIKTTIDNKLKKARKKAEDWHPKEDTDLHGDDDFSDFMDEMTTVQKSLSKLRKHIGLDIPESQDVDPENVGVDGLRD